MALTIAVYAICRNEEANVCAWLDSVQEADAIYVADTGSTDGTWKQFSKWYSLHPWSRSKVHLQSIAVEPWRFDVARNASLALVPASVDICVVVDLDETLSPGWKQAIREYWHGGVNNIRPWYVGSDRYQSWDGRRIHSRAGWVWRHACHEQLYPYGGVANFADARDIVITHNRFEIHGSYLNLCYMAWREAPTDAHTQFFLGREYWMCGLYEQAEEMLGHYLEREDTEPEERRLAGVFLQRTKNMHAIRDSDLPKVGMELRQSGLVVPV